MKTGSSAQSQPNSSISENQRSGPITPFAPENQNFCAVRGKQRAAANRASEEGKFAGDKEEEGNVAPLQAL